MYQYRIVTHVDGYQVEYSYLAGTWQAYGKVYMTKLFAKLRIKREISADKYIVARKQREESFVPKVVYGPYP